MNHLGGAGEYRKKLSEELSPGDTPTLKDRTDEKKPVKESEMG